LKIVFWGSRIMLRHHNGMFKDRMRKQKCKCNCEHQNSILQYQNSIHRYHKARNEQQNLELGMQNSNINIGGNHPPYPVVPTSFNESGLYMSKKLFLDFILRNFILSSYSIFSENVLACVCIKVVDLFYRTNYFYYFYQERKFTLYVPRFWTDISITVESKRRQTSCLCFRYYSK
jgi:hypothetical protein